MILTAHQPAYLPWLGLFHKIAISDAFVILDDVQFEKNSFTNRNKIKTSQGAIWLTVPILISGHLNKSIKDIEINNKEDWRDKHWKGLYMNYKKAPYFSKYSGFFEDLYKKEWLKLFDLLAPTMEFLLKELNIQTKVYFQSKLNISSKKEELILDLCKHFNADLFIFGALGKNYADSALFESKGVKLYFQDYVHPTYPQLWGEFLPYMSIVDLLFNVGPVKASEVIMAANITKEKVKEMVISKRYWS